MNASNKNGKAEMKRYNVVGAEMRFLSGPSDSDADVAMVTAVFTPGFCIPLHRHKSPEIIYALDGALEVYQNGPDGVGWKVLAQNEAVTIGRDVWHAIRNSSGWQVSALAITEGDLWSFFHAVAAPLSDGEQPGPPPPEAMRTLFEAAFRFGYQMGTPEQNQIIGINLGAQ